jgi:DNA-directed RNA polymerase subunit RPC12/RpoP
MTEDRIASFQRAPADANYKCDQCGHIMAVREGETVPPCPRCGFRLFHRTDQGIPC